MSTLFTCFVFPLGIWGLATGLDNARICLYRVRYGEYFLPCVILGIDRTNDLIHIFPSVRVQFAATFHSNDINHENFWIQIVERN